MSRIFPDSNYNIFEDLNNPRSKSEWGYGYEKSSNSEFINYKEFIDKLDQYVDSNFKIWLGTDPYNPLYFSEICIFDQENGTFHLIEYFPFKHQEQVNYIFNPNAFKRGVLIKDRVFKNKKNPKSFSSKEHHLYLNNILELKKIYNNKGDKGQLSDVDERRKKDILNYNNKFEKLLKDYKTIKDDPVNRLNRFCYGITDSLNISNDDAKSFRENNIYKHFFFGNLNSEYKEDYFITSEDEKKIFSSQKAYNYGKGINYYGREDFQLLIDKINKQIKNPIWNSKKHVKKIEFNFLPVIKKVEKNKPKKLSDIQIKHVNRKAFSRRMRISGVAGSGKTFCLTTRAMNYANNDKNVLYTFFTSSFKSYVIHNLENPDFTYKRRVGNYNKPSIVVKNIHMLFSEMIDQYYLHIKSLGLKDDEGLDFRNIGKIKPEKNKSFEVAFTTKINRLIKHDEKVFFDAMGNVFDFDAIMVDEGQNFKSSWFSVLQKVCLKNRPKNQTYGDMMVAFDDKQKLFGDNEVGESIKELSKPELINDPLNATYRIPPNLFEKVNIVRKKLGLSKIEYIIPNKKDLDFMSEGEYEWINIPKNFSSIDDKSEFIVNNTLKIIKKNSLKLGDSAIITDDHTIMAKIQDLINKKNLLENNDAHLEKITDEQEILDKNKNHTTMILTECLTNIKRSFIIYF